MLELLIDKFVAEPSELVWLSTWIVVCPSPDFIVFLVEPFFLTSTDWPFTLTSVLSFDELEPDWLELCLVSEVTSCLACL